MATDDKQGERDRPTRARTPSGGTTGPLGPVDQKGVSEQLRDQHERRTTVPGAPDVDARLDNRRGSDRPPLEKWPAKPQQIDGPDVVGQVEHTRRVLADRENEDYGDRKGMFSPGPHGLSDESQRRGEAPASEEGYQGKTTSNEEGESGKPKAG